MAAVAIVGAVAAYFLSKAYEEENTINEIAETVKEIKDVQETPVHIEVQKTDKIDKEKRKKRREKKQQRIVEALDGKISERFVSLEDRLKILYTPTREGIADIVDQVKKLENEK